MIYVGFVKYVFFCVFLFNFLVVINVEILIFLVNFVSINNMKDYDKFSFLFGFLFRVFVEYLFWVGWFKYCLDLNL